MVTDGTAVRGIGYRAFHVAMMFVVVAAILIVGAGIGAGVWQRVKPDERQTSVRLVSDGSTVSGASSLLTRGDSGIDFTLKTSGLAIGHIATLRGEIFNHPENCTHGVAPLRCGDQDLADRSVGGSVVFLASSYLRATDSATFFGHLSANDDSRAISGKGLTNPRGAAIHLVVMDHGSAIPDIFHDMSTTLGAGCTNPPKGGGAPGPNECIDLQYASHE